MRRVSSHAAALLLAAGAACARIQPPPGGPEDTAPPLLLAVVPDSLQSLPGFDGDVEFQFNETVSEGGQPNFGTGSGDLERLVLLSPSDQVPVVRWHRSRITVRPREGWRPQTVYRVELLGGLRDLRNNTWRGSTVVTFTTGGELPADSLTGRVVDWTNSRPVANATVEAILMPDSLAYRTTADSTGRFRLAPLPAGEYLVVGVIDQNRNARWDLRENFDSIRVAPGVDSVGELWAFRHDTLPPRITAASVVDTLTVMLTFGASLDPYQRITPDSVRVLALPDSVPVPVRALLPKPAFDSLFAVRDSTAPDSGLAAVDSTGARAPPPPPPPPPPAPPTPPRLLQGAEGARLRDTTDRGPLTTRPPLFDRLHLRTAEAIDPAARYLIEVAGVRTVSGVADSARTILAPQSARVIPLDSLRATRPPRPASDSVRPPPRGEQEGSGLAAAARPRRRPVGGRA